MDVSRKTFVETLLAGSALLVFHGCGGGSDYNGSAGNPMPTTGCSDAISNNHGHVLTIAVTDLDSTTAKTYDIRGTATTHTHTVTFTPAQLAQLKAGTVVTVTSTPAATDGHMHDAAVTCIVP
jgi:hypothetical protein